MAKKNKQEAPNIEQEIVKPIDFDFKDNDIIEIVGCGNFGLKDGKTFKVGGKLAKVLISKGAAKLKDK